MNTAKGAGKRLKSNTGRYKESILPKIMKGIVLVPKGVDGPRWAANASNATINATVRAWLVALPKADDYTQRGQFIGPLIGIDDKSTEPVYQEYNYGTKVLVNEGQYMWGFDYREGGMSYAMSVKAFSGRADEYNYVALTNEGQVHGCNYYTTDAQGNVSVGGFDAIPLQQLDVQKMTTPTKDKEAGFKVMISPEFISDINEDACIVETGDASIIKAVQAATVIDVALTSLGINGNAGVYDVAIFTADGKTNLATGPYALAWDYQCFNVIRVATGAPITVTSVSVAADALRITINTSDPDWALTQPVRISLANVSTVYEVLGGNYESNEVVMVDND